MKQAFVGMLVQFWLLMSHTAAAAGSHRLGQPFEPNPATLVNVSFTGLIATQIPDYFRPREEPLPAQLVQLMIDGIKSPPLGYWMSKIKAQIRFTYHRQVHRRAYLAGPGGQLMLPPESVWKIQIDPGHRGPLVFVRKNHVYVGIEYSFESVLVARRGSVHIAEPALGILNGSYTEHWWLPLDPEFFFQRTQYACVDETKEWAAPVITSFNAWNYFDDTCTAGSSTCHRAYSSPLSCQQALRSRTGATHVAITWTRIPYSASVASQFRVGRVRQRAQDLVNQPTHTFYLYYQYFPVDSCLVGFGNCVMRSGWRRLLTFNQQTYNNGYRRFLNIARLGSNPANSSFVRNHVYQYNECLQTYQHRNFVQMSFVNMQAKPSASCIRDSVRWFGVWCEPVMNLSSVMNHEFSPLATQYDRCEWQGISSGWASKLVAGSSCNWIDVTDVVDGRKHVLETRVNPAGALCEGRNVYTPRPKLPIYVTNGNQTGGDPVWPECEPDANYTDNNVVQTQLAVRKSLAAVVQRCPRGSRPLSQMRDCGWSVAAEAVPCIPGSSTAITLTRVSLYYTDPVTQQTVYNNPTMMVRICESSYGLGKRSVRCQYVDAIAHALMLPSQPVTVVFPCPGYRDVREPGGLYSILIAKYASFENLGVPVPNVTLSLA